MKQIYCKEGTLCCQYRLEARKIVKKLTFNKRGFLLILFILFFLFSFQKEFSSIPAKYFVFSLLLLIFIIILAALTKEILYYRYYFYDITEKEIIIRKGVISRQEIIVPFFKIQDVYVDQDFFDRIFGLYDVHLSSAAIGSYILAHIDGVNASSAEALKKILIEKTRNIKTREL